MAWTPDEQAAMLEILHNRTRWPLLECQGEGADAVYKDSEVYPQLMTWCCLSALPCRAQAQVRACIES